MNDKHQGPHCAGLCEGAAYQIEIRKLRAENEALWGALVSLQAWVTDEGFEDTHEGVAEICGQARGALAAHDQGGDQ